MIYECTRTIDPQIDASCMYTPELENYICTVNHPYQGHYECEFDYGSSHSYWYEEYNCYSGQKKCGESIHTIVSLDKDNKKYISTSGLTGDDVCEYQFYVPKPQINTLI